MDKRTMAKGYATEVLKKYKLISPTLDSLVYIVGDYGFEIIDFGRESNPGGVAFRSEICRSKQCFYIPT